MPIRNPYGRPEPLQRDRHSLRILACISASLLLLIGAVRLWPAPTTGSEEDVVYTSSGPETVFFEEIVPTSQVAKPPPPPAPLPPVVVPDDEILEDELELDEFLPVDAFGIAGDPPPSADAQETARRRADTAPEPVRVVAPEYTRAARRRGIRAEIVIVVIINEGGRVEETTIVERFLLGEDEALRRKVDALGFGLEESAIQAAGRWLFRPASEDGRPVRSEHQISLKFGV